MHVHDSLATAIPIPNGQNFPSGRAVAVMQRPWPLAKANGFILAWGPLTAHWHHQMPLALP
jgi:hypothetical protein